MLWRRYGGKLKDRFGELAYKQTRLTLVVALSVGLILALVQILFDYAIEKNRIETELARVLSATAPAASDALWTLDGNLARNVTEGLVSLPLIESARIVAFNSAVLSEASEHAGVNPDSKLDTLIDRFNRMQFVALYHVEGGQRTDLGQLEIEVSAGHAWLQFMKRVAVILTTGLLKALILAVFLLWLFHRTLTRPISDYMRWLKQLDPAVPEAWTHSEPIVKNGHDLAEFGHLAATRFYQAREHFLALQRTREQLKMLNTELESRVEDRTAELNQALQRTREMAATDELTGLHNRRYFIELAEQRHAEWLRSRRPYALLMLDLDHFKQINDTYGHPVGDRVLQHVAQALTSAKRKEDVLCRFGGEEFAMLLTVDGATDIIRLAQRFCKTLELCPMSLEQKDLFITGSFGLLPPAALSDEFTENLKRVDQALYQAKANGRNQVAVYSALVDQIEHLQQQQSAEKSSGT